ncbi:microtubule-associated protein 9 [Rhinophrynus dorsalis]
MDNEDDNFSTSLAYSKSPKTAKRTSFQDELKKVISARVSRQQALEETENSAEYSEEFDSDDSLDDSYNEKNTIESKVKKALQDFHISDEDDNVHRKVSFLKNKTQFDKINNELEHEGITGDKNKINSENNRTESPVFEGKKDIGVIEEKTFFEEIAFQGMFKHLYDGRKESLNQWLNKLVIAAQGYGTSTPDNSFKPTPQQRHLPRKITYTEDKDSSQTDKENYQNKRTSVSAPSSLSAINNKVSAMQEHSDPERHSSPVPKSQSFSTLFGESSVTISRESSPEVLKDMPVGEIKNNGKSDLQASGRNSPSVFEMLLSTVKEKSVQQETKDPFQDSIHSHPASEQGFHSKDELLDEKHGQYKQKITKDKKDEHLEIIRRQLNSRKEIAFMHLLLSEAGVRVESGARERRWFQGCPCCGQGHGNIDVTTRSLNALQTSKKSSKSGTHMSARFASSVKSRYLGTLTVLDKSVKESGSGIEAADAVRAAVYQNWMEKKKVFLQEVIKIKKHEEEQEKEKTIKESNNKKEDAVAAFQAWRTEKIKQSKMHLTKQRQEEEKKMREIQEIARKKEESKKAFEKWKEDKEEHLKEKMQKQKHTEMELKEREQRHVLEKKKDSTSAIQKWNEQKKHMLKEKKREKMYEKKKQEQAKFEKEEKEKKALELYEQWLERKERRERIEKKQKKIQVILDNEPPPPWSPPGKTIPTGK